MVDLSGLDVKTLQPRLNALKRYAQARHSMSEDDLYATVFQPVFRQIAEEYPHTGAFSVAATCEACEAALSQHLGECVDALRNALRPASCRTEQVGSSFAPTGDTDNVSATPGSLVVLEDPARVAGTRAEELLDRARDFAASAGLGSCVQADPQSGAGVRLSTLPTEDAAHPERHRAWWLLAGILGQLEPDAPPPVSLNLGFLRWLIDAEDASARAYWEVLACVRRTRAASARSDGVGGSVDSAGDA